MVVQSTALHLGAVQPQPSTVMSLASFPPLIAFCTLAKTFDFALPSSEFLLPHA